MSITINREKLVLAAREARERAYAPYSNYRVGAALLTEDGQVFTGCNVENAVYPAGNCAERVAIEKAVSEGNRRFVAIAVATDNGGTPCGVCRQVMNEFAPNLIVILADAEGITSEMPLQALLPHAFGPKDIA
jgi:cytidine deaminase